MTNKNDASAPAPSAVERSSSKARADLSGLYFTHIGPVGADRCRAVRLGVVTGALGLDHWLLEFRGNGYYFSNVVSTADTARLVFFARESDRQTFLDDLAAQEHSRMAGPDEAA